MPLDDYAFRRITNLPPYVFTVINDLKAAARRAGDDVVDLGFGNPDIPSPSLAVDKLAEAAHNGRNHRYSLSAGIPKLRQAVAGLYERRFGVALDPETEIVSTIGAKEGLSHLMWVLLGPGDSAVVPTPSYPIHIYAPLFAGAEVQQVRLDGDHDFVEGCIETFRSQWPRPRVIICSFPHNPTTKTIDLAGMKRLVDFALENDVVLVHDFAYAETYFDGEVPPSVLQVPGAKECSVELYTMTKSFSMAGWRVGFLVGNARVVAALKKLKSYLDYGTFQPIQIAATVTLNEASDYPLEVNEVYRARRDALCDSFARIGWDIERPKGTMFVWAKMPEAYRAMGSLEFSKLLVTEAKVATSPGVGFGHGGEGYVRFALIENEKRIAQAARTVRRALPLLHS